MSRKDSLIKLRQDLLARLSRLQGRLVGDLNSLDKSIHAGPGDMVDAAQQFGEESVDCFIAESDSREIELIRKALAKSIEEFGKCEGCGKSIPIERLDYRPHSAYCVKCQQAAEKNGSGRDLQPNWGRLGLPEEEHEGVATIR